MNDITQYYIQQIKARDDRNKELQDENLQLRQYIYDLLDEDVPDDYKRVIRHEVFGTNINYEIE